MMLLLYFFALHFFFLTFHPSIKSQIVLNNQRYAMKNSERIFIVAAFSMFDQAEIDGRETEAKR